MYRELFRKEIQERVYGCVTVYYNSFRIIRTTSGFTIDNNKNWYGNTVTENANKIYKVIGYKEV